MTLPGAQRRVYSVSGFSGEVRRLLESSYPELWIEGEISNLSSPASGHSYFSLVDDKAQVRCALFRQRKLRSAVAPRNGLKVLLRARVSLYEARGDFQLIVDYMEDAGEGALRRAVEELRRTLEAEGLFDPARRRPLPAIPARVGVISSATGAALRDILITLRRGAPWLPVVVYPATVQGDQAPAAIVAALRRAVRRAECDVLLLARGGGSLEDLMAFNDESVVRAVSDCPIPLVSGVGHETDTTLVDFVADHRAATPTAAAQLLASVGEVLANRLEQQQSRLVRAMENRVYRASQGVDRLAGRMRHPLERLRHQRSRVEHAGERLQAFARHRLATSRGQVEAMAARLAGRAPSRRVAQASAEVDALAGRAGHALRARLADAGRRIEARESQLRALSPRHTLGRGFAILLDDAHGTVVSRVDQARPGQRLSARVSDGTLGLQVRDDDNGDGSSS